MYQYFPNLTAEVTDIPAAGVVSRTIFKNENVQMLVFGFDDGQELSEHTSARPAILHFLEGKATVTLGEDTFETEAGAWVYMAPHLPHSILAHGRLIMQLILLPG